MAGTKRRRGTSKTPKGKQTSKPKSTAVKPVASNVKASELAPWKILKRLWDLVDDTKPTDAKAKSNKTRIQLLFEAFPTKALLVDPSTLSKSKSNPNYNWDTYWWILATELLQHLLKQLLLLQDDSNDSDQDVNSVVLLTAALCDALTQVLSKTDKKIEKGGPLVMRTVWAITMASCRLVSFVTASATSKVTDDTRTMAYRTAMASLDSLVHFQITSLPYIYDVRGEYIQVETIREEVEDVDIQEACRGVGLLEVFEDCVQRLAIQEEVSLADSTSTETTPPAKRAARSTRRKKTTDETPGASLTELFQSLQAVFEGELPKMKLEGRMTIRRYVSTILSWWNHGRVELLQATSQLKDLRMSVWEKSFWARRSMVLVAESSNHASPRPLTGSLEQYITSVSTWSSGQTSPRELRDVSVVAIYAALQLHTQCLQDANVPIVNDAHISDYDDDGGGDDDEDGDDMQEHVETDKLFLTVAPGLGRHISSLCRVAGASVAGATPTVLKMYTETLRGIATALAFPIIANRNLPLDCSLADFVLENLSGILRGLHSQSLQRDWNLQDLQVPLNLPPVWNPSTNTSLRGSRQTSDYAGILPSEGSFTKDDFFALSIRSLHTEAVTVNHQGETIGSIMLATLTDIGRRACRWQLERQVQQSNEGKSESTARKRSKASSRRSKRQKTGDGKAQEVAVETRAAPTEIYRRLTETRAAVLKNVLTTLRYCLHHEKTLRNNTVRYLRPELNARRIREIIGLATLVDKVLVKTRHAPSKAIAIVEDNEDESSDESGLFQMQNVHKNEFHAFEEDVWNELILMCLVLGRGTTHHSPLQNLLFNDSQVHAVLAEVQGESEHWPLALPTCHQALLMAYHTSNAGPRDEHLVQITYNAIEHVLSNLASINSAPKKQNFLYLQDEILLSRRDAQLFVLVSSRLPVQRRLHFVESLVTCLLNTIQQPDTSEILMGNREACSFLARVIVICSVLINFVSHGDQLKQELVLLCGTSGFNLPNFLRWDEWYSAEQSYMGIFSNWESPLVRGLDELPATTFDRHSEQAWVKNNTLKDFKTTLLLIFELSFEASRNDNCHLMFAAWNGLCKLQRDYTGPISQQIDTTTLQIGADELPTRLLQMRDDIYMVYEEVKRIDDGNRRMSALKYRSNLKSMVHRANILVGRLAKSADELAGGSTSLSFFALLKALPAYIAASMGAHTKPGKNCFTAALSVNAGRQSKQRRYSAGSENFSSDGESVEIDAEMDAATLRESCDAFGSAPIHPDWLDTTCDFRDGVRPSDAVANAETAVSMLNKVIALALQQYKSSLAKVFAVYARDIRIKELLLQILPLGGRNFTTDCGLTGEDWKENVLRMSGIPQALIDLVISAMSSKNQDSAKKAWCPNAAKRLASILLERPIHRWDISASELRCRGEWEMLLGEALIPEFLLSPQRDGALPLSNEDGIHAAALHQAILWKTVLASAANHLIPAMALLRMGLFQVGRKQHPFSRIGSGQDPFECSKIRISESISLVENVPALVELTTKKTLALLGYVSIVGDSALSTVCHAVSCHIFEDMASFVHVEALQGLHIVSSALSSCLRNTYLLTIQEDQGECFEAVVETLLRLITGYAQVNLQAEHYGMESRSFRHLHNFVIGHTTEPVSTIIGKISDFADVFESITKEDSIPGWKTFEWMHRREQSPLISSFAQILCGVPSQRSRTSRNLSAFLLQGLLESNPKEEGRDASLFKVMSVFNDANQQTVTSLLLDHFVRPGTMTREEIPFRKSLSRLLQVFLESSESFNHTENVFETLISSLQNLSADQEEAIQDLLAILFTYGCRLKKLHQISEKLFIESSHINEEVSAKIAVDLIDFASGMAGALKEENKLRSEETQLSRVQDENRRNGFWSSLKPPFPSMCTFVQKSGYHGQHWYNCYTCGLVWEKGCCTLCAVTCHKGHDVSYSRYSSFFCDCGAEESSSEQNRVSCKCLSPMPSADISDAFGEEKTRPIQESDSDCAGLHILSHRYQYGINLLATHWKQQSRESLDSFLSSLNIHHWFNQLFRVLEEKFQEWKSSQVTIPEFASLAIRPFHESSLSSHRISSVQKAEILRLRRGKVLQLEFLTHPGMILIRSIKGINVAVSSDQSAVAHITARLARYQVSRSIIAADSRGRIVVAEPFSLRFCSSVPSCVTQYNQRRTDTPLSRDELSIIYSAPVRINVVGLQMCPTNDQLLLIWGTKEVSILFLNQCWDGVERQVDLAVDVDQPDGDTDCVLKCDWVPGSEKCILVACSRFMLVFDLTKANERKRATAQLKYHLGFEAPARDVALLPTKSLKHSGNGLQMVRVFILLSNGRLNSIDLKLDSFGGLQTSSLQLFEKNAALSLPISGACLREGFSTASAGALTKTFGEGSTVAFLKQSRVLLYSCHSSCVMAIMIDKFGRIESSFELLPHTITSATLSGTSKGYSIVGPFGNWTELGITYRDSGTFFRVACVCRSSRGNRPVMLCIEFNESKVFAREISCLDGALDGLATITSFEGLCTFSLPFVAEAELESQRFGERLYLSAMLSDGTLLFFGEDSTDTVSCDESKSTGKRPIATVPLNHSLQIRQPDFPVTVFETLKNIGDRKETFFIADGIGYDRAELKSRLSRDSTSSFVCRRPQGCTICIGLHNPKQDSLKDDSPELGTIKRTLVIVAVRLLVGSSLQGIPSTINVQGRSLDLSPRLKKWYSIPLTEEEIALGVRNGMICVGLGPGFDVTSNIVVDSIEVYATERENVEPWLETAYLSETEREARPLESFTKPLNDPSKQHGTKYLLSCISAIKNMLELSSDRAVFKKEVVRPFLAQLVEALTFSIDSDTRNSISSLVALLEPNERARNGLCDASVVIGSVRALMDIQRIIDGTIMGETDDKSIWAAICATLNHCLSMISAMARTRPMNYLQSLQKTVESFDGISNCSVASQSTNMILEGKGLGIRCEDLVSGTGGVVHLCLMEIVIGLTTGQGKYLAKFDSIRKLLECPDIDVLLRTCEGIRSFCEYQSPKEEGSDMGSDIFTLLQGTRLVAYQCDVCGLCPLKDTRYTLPEEEHFDIDLCKHCYTLAKQFAEQNDFAADVEVVVGGQSVGATSKLTCAQMMHIRPVLLEKLDVTQIEMQEGEETSHSQAATQSDSYDDFLSHLFHGITDVLSLESYQDTPRMSCLIDLQLFLIRKIRSKTEATAKAREFTHHITKSLATILIENGRDDIDHAPFVMFLRSLRMLMMPRGDVATSREINSRSKSKTHPHVMCDVHNIPAVRRRSPRGPHKDRRFYVCGMERGQRCKFFQWADELVDNLDINANSAPKELREIVLASLWKSRAKHNQPLHESLCGLLTAVLSKDDEECDSKDSEKFAGSDPRRTSKDLAEKSRHDRDIADGVYCSRERLSGDLSPGDFCSLEKNGASSVLLEDGDAKALLLDSCLEVISLVADHRTVGIHEWFALLCEIETSDRHTNEIRCIAKNCFKALCGKKRSLYHSIRNHFSYGFELQRLFATLTDALKASRVVSEMARVSSNDWASKTKFERNSVARFIGAEDLVSEDSVPTSSMLEANKILDHLWSVVKSSAESWRRFCSFDSMPRGEKFALSGDLASLPPILVLFWSACSAQGMVQFKLLRLVAMALTATPNEKRRGRTTEASEGEIETVLLTFYDSSGGFSDPKMKFLHGEDKFSLEEVAALVMHFVYGGRSTDIRKAGLQIGSSLLANIPRAGKVTLFELLLSSKFMNLGSLGRASLEFLNLLQILAGQLGNEKGIEIHASLVLDSFISQLNASRYDASNGEWGVVETASSTKRRFDLADCRYCLQSTNLRLQKENQKSVDRRDSSPSNQGRRSTQAGRNSSNNTARVAGHSSKVLHPEQVSAFYRSRLESMKHDSASNEFTCFVALKQRMVISNFFLTISDPRGRFVKTIKIYCSPRPSEKAMVLKVPEYDSKWQLCATISLPRGASRASGEFVHAIVAANLKIEYADFYERPGGSKSSDGSLLVHCPRCTRIVTNAHGVCGNCGEVAFQCRKCRHINYDRLDAFLCVECGYCASGSFAFEFMAAGASNAVAICNDDNFDLTVKRLGAINSLHQDFKGNLSDELQEAMSFSEARDHNIFNEELTRAFSGRPPSIDGGKAKLEIQSDRLEKEGSVVRMVSRPEFCSQISNSTSAADRTRSLLRLARQIRNGSNTASDRRASGNVIIRHLGNLSSDGVLNQDLESGDVLEGDSRVRTLGSYSGSSNPKQSSTSKEKLAQLQKDYVLLREAGRERYELQRRLDAWHMLNEGRLVDIGRPISSDDVFECSHCSMCSSTVAFQLLILWSQLFDANPSEVLVDEDFLGILLTSGGTVGKSLSELMRKVAKDIALKSKHGAKMLLKVLKKRLHASDDTMSAEILGDIMEQRDFFMIEEYSMLAMEVLRRDSINI